MSIKDDVIKLTESYYDGIRFRTFKYSEISDEVNLDFEVTQSFAICCIEGPEWNFGELTRFEFGVAVIDDRIFLEIVRIEDEEPDVGGTRYPQIYETDYSSLEEFLSCPLGYLVTHPIPTINFREEILRSPGRGEFYTFGYRSDYLSKYDLQYFVIGGDEYRSILSSKADG